MKVYVGGEALIVEEGEALSPASPLRGMQAAREVLQHGAA